MRQESLHHLLSERRQGLFTIHSLQSYSSYMIYNCTYTVPFSQKFIWFFPGEEVLLWPPAGILCPGSLDSSPCIFSHAPFPAGDPLAEPYPASKLPCQLAGSHHLLKSVPLPTLHAAASRSSSATHLLLSLHTPSQPHLFPALGVLFDIEYVSGWLVFWEVAVSPSCDSCL